MRRIKSILSWAIGIVLGFGVVLAASVVVDRAWAVGKVDTLTNTIIPNGSQPAVRAYVARPDGAGPYPAVIMLHEWWGLKADVVAKAEALAEDGYVVIAPDMYRGITTDWIPTAIYQVSTVAPSQIDDDLDSVLAWATAQPMIDRGRIAVMGFCFGGGTALRYAVATPAITATAVFYGAVITDETALKQLNGPVLGIFGGADAMIPVSDAQALDNALLGAGIPHDIQIYEGSGHAFVSDLETIRTDPNAQRAWQALRVFLATTFHNAKQPSGDAPVHPTSTPHTVATANPFDRALHLFVCSRAVVLGNTDSKTTFANSPRDMLN
ncbi:MAG: hypothetical protein RLZZ297_2095 [Chloroflexota bacterium]|jgi:carboxymethylenebutenolidase